MYRQQYVPRSDIIGDNVDVNVLHGVGRCHSGGDERCCQRSGSVTGECSIEAARD